MKKKNGYIKVFKTVSILLIIFLISFAGITIRTNLAYEFGSFKNKSYYTSIFNQNEITELNNAFTIYEKGQVNMLKAEKYFRKADGYYKIDENTQGKNYKKAVKYENKAIKTAVASYKLYFEAINKTFRTYSQSLGRIENNNSKKHLKAEELTIDARTLYMNGLELKQQANKLKGADKTNILKKAYIQQINALKQQEYAFMIFMNDPGITYDIKNDKVVINDTDEDNIVDNTVNTDTDFDNNTGKTNDYDPGKDPNIYVSKEDEIVVKLNMSESDKMLLEDAGDKRGFADILMKEVDKDYVKIDNIRYEAAGIDDNYERELKIKMASGLEKILFNKMIKAAKLYYEANKLTYEVYHKYLPSARNPENFNKGQQHERKAETLHSNAQKIYNRANFSQVNKSNLYVQLMNAVQTELSAIQEQENAFSTYFKFKVVPLDDPKEVIVVENNVETNAPAIKKMSYNYIGSYIYSVSDPEPAPLKHKEGIIFKVQLGLFKGLLSLGQYGKYSPISYDTFKNNPYRRFFLGEFRSYKAAEYVLNKVVRKGLSDPFIVVFENGERRTATYGIAKIIRDDEFEKIEGEEMAFLTANKDNINMNVTKVDHVNTDEINNINDTEGIVYCVQLGNFSSAKSLKDFNGIKPVYTEMNETLYRYMTGTFNSYTDAKEAAKEVALKGYKEAFVIAYHNGIKISLDDAKKLSVGNININNKVIKKETDEIYFSVQIGVYSQKLTENDLKKFNNITNKYKLSVKQTKDGLYLYYIGKYKTYNDASVAKKDIISKNHDGFVIAFKNDHKISAKEASELLKNK